MLTQICQSSLVFKSMIPNPRLSESERSRTQTRTFFGLRVCDATSADTLGAP
jgi:hypothetical protein